MRTIEQSIEYVKEVAFTFVMENWNNEYLDFLEMIKTETEFRWYIPHYMAVKFTLDKEQAAWELAFFIHDYDRLNYVEDTRSLLAELHPEIAEIKEVFRVYDLVRSLPKRERSEEALEAIVGANHPEYLEPFL